MVKSIKVALIISLNCSFNNVEQNNTPFTSIELAASETSITKSVISQNNTLCEDTEPAGSETPITIRRKVKKAIDNSIIIGATISVYRGSTVEPIIVIESGVNGFELSLLSGDEVHICKNNFHCLVYNAENVTTEGDDFLQPNS